MSTVVEDDVPSDKVEEDAANAVTADLKQSAAVACSDNASQSPPNKKKKGREICGRCHRPSLRTCICASLPDERILLEKCRFLCLQHPLELKQKNRSLPLLQLVLEEKSLLMAVGRKLGPDTMQKAKEEFRTVMESNDEPLLLVYPGPDAVSLEEGLKRVEGHQHQTGRINILFIDATWRFAGEMDKANTTDGFYPKNLIRIQLAAASNESIFGSVRTAPSRNHLSTAECMASVASQIEDSSKNIYEALTKPIQCAADQYKGFQNEKNIRYKPASDTRGSKRRKIATIHGA